MWGEGFAFAQKALLPKSGGLSILPSTVSQLLSATALSQDTFSIQDSQLHQVSVVGVVRGFAPFVTNVQYSVDDMTGPPLVVKQWVNAEEPLKTLQCQGKYVKVIGSLRNFNGQRLLMAMDVRQVTDLNEITSHMMEVVQAHRQLSGEVLEEIRRHSDCDRGVEFNDVKAELSYITAAEIRTSLTFLLSQGHVFFTTDQLHFKAADY